jgi:membrane protease YdiL (CAAX protease family)
VTATEFRILSQIALACLLMLPFGLLMFAPQRRFALVSQAQDEVGQPTPYRLGWADFMASVMLCGFLALIQFAGKAAEMAMPAAEHKLVAPPISVGVLLANLMVVQGLQFGIAWAWFSLRQTSLVKVFGLRRYSFLESLGKAAIMIIPAGITAMVGLVVGSMILQHLGWPMQDQDAVAMLKSQQSFLVNVLLIFGACVGAPVVEEILFRGFLYGSLRNLTNKWFAAVVSALIFGVVHMHIGSFTGLCLLGFFFAVAYEVTGSLLVCILMHALFNSVQTVMAYSAG